MQPILDLLCIHLFIIELSWKSNISYLATCPIKKQGGPNAIIIKVIGLTHSGGKDSEKKCWIKENLDGIYSEYNNCKGPGLHLFNGTTRFSMSTSP